MRLPFRITGNGPFGVEDVTRLTGVSRRSLLIWHDRGWARATHRTSGRGCLRYQRTDIRHIAIVAALREEGIRPDRAARLASRVELALVKAGLI